MGPPQANHGSEAHRIFMGRETNEAKETAKSWQRKDIKDLPSLLSQILLSLDKTPSHESPHSAPAEEPAVHTSGSSKESSSLPQVGPEGLLHF